MAHTYNCLNKQSQVWDTNDKSSHTHAERVPIVFSSGKLALTQSHISLWSTAGLMLQGHMGRRSHFFLAGSRHVACMAKSQSAANGGTRTPLTFRYHSASNGFVILMYQDHEGPGFLNLEVTNILWIISHCPFPTRNNFWTHPLCSANIRGTQCLCHSMQPDGQDHLHIQWPNTNVLWKFQN